MTNYIAEAVILCIVKNTRAITSPLIMSVSSCVSLVFSVGIDWQLKAFYMVKLIFEIIIELSVENEMKSVVINGVSLRHAMSLEESIDAWIFLLLLKCKGSRLLFIYVCKENHCRISEYNLQIVRYVRRSMNTQ